MAKVRFECDHCDCLNEKRPYFKPLVTNYWADAMQKHKREEALMKQIKEGYENTSTWCCITCLHPAKFHKFSFKEPITI